MISEEVVESVAVTAALVRVVPQLQAQLGLTDQLLEIVHVLHNSLDYKSLREAAKKLFFLVARPLSPHPSLSGRATKKRTFLRLPLTGLFPGIRNIKCILVHQCLDFFPLYQPHKMQWRSF